jgi:hypothetical protein
MNKFYTKSDKCGVYLGCNGKNVYSNSITSPLFYINSPNGKIILNDEEVRIFVNHRDIVFRYDTKSSYQIMLEENNDSLFKSSMYIGKTFKIIRDNKEMNHIVVRDEQNYCFNFYSDFFHKNFHLIGVNQK